MDIINQHFSQINLIIPRVMVNRFLDELWDELNASIGRVGCSHQYAPTEDPELYCYRIFWSDSTLNFQGVIKFYNHTAKGVVRVDYSAISRDTNTPDLEVEKKIALAVRIAKEKCSSLPEEPQYYASLPFRTDFEISGNYCLDCSGILLLKAGKDESFSGRLIFSVYAKSGPELNNESHQKMMDICASLSTLTQILFEPILVAGCDLYGEEHVQQIRERSLWSDLYADDSGFLNYDASDLERGKSREIIEERDCLSTYGLVLPQQADLVLSRILQEQSWQQSCSRFSEALYFRGLQNRNKISIQMISYELIAYTASIEALLDAGKAIKEIKCENCQTVLLKEDWKISEKYRTFVITHCEDNDAQYRSFFKPLYEDRSKFVHTGRDLYDVSAIRPGRPMRLSGKIFATRVPAYYYNIHELTGWLLRKHFYVSALTCSP